MWQCLHLILMKVRKGEASYFKCDADGRKQGAAFLLDAFHLIMAGTLWVGLSGTHQDVLLFEFAGSDVLKVNVES